MSPNVNPMPSVNRTRFRLTASDPTFASSMYSAFASPGSPVSSGWYMISVTRRDSATGPTAYTASFNALHSPLLRTRALTTALLAKRIGPLYSTALPETPTSGPPLVLPADNSARISRSVLVRELFRPWIASRFWPARSEPV